ncbi:MAG: hydrogenase expression/formation protein HypC [Campylobacterota bacterium]|nr:hydrogenase expression/formation protein HypC [Campylobacterota bacterium]
MCLSIPSKITKIDEISNIATVDTMGVLRDVSLDLIDTDVKIGDFVLIHVGFAMKKIDEEEAIKSLELYEEILKTMDEESNNEA